MDINEDWVIPQDARPNQADFNFPLEPALSAVVAVHSRIPKNAFTAPILGTERGGNGVVISDDGLVLTIGYLITEADEIWLTTNHGVVAQADVLAYDQISGFGLLQALGKLGVAPLIIGDSAASEIGDPVIFAGSGGHAKALAAKISAKREFAGYWEYLLDQAIFTTPAYPHWGGAAVIGADGRLQGIGSLYIQDMKEDGAKREGNMVVPIELLEPILNDMKTLGRVDQPPRPWIGVYASDDAGEHPVIMGLAKNGPADRAGIDAGDVILEVADQPVRGLAHFFRQIWALGPAGAEVELTVARDDEIYKVSLTSIDRNDLLRKPSYH
jgi:S1-C subfamily serine protease